MAFHRIAQATTLSLLAALASCNLPSPSTPRPPADRKAPAFTPSCQSAVAEFTFKVDFQNPSVVKDGLVGECVELRWSREERGCVAVAATTSELAECVTTQVRMSAVNTGAGGAVGIADCDRTIARYRECISSALPVAIAADTQEALEITLAEWREQIATSEAGWQKVQSECSALSASLTRTLSRYGCDRGR